MSDEKVDQEFVAELSSFVLNEVDGKSPSVQMSVATTIMANMMARLANDSDGYERILSAAAVILQGMRGAMIPLYPHLAADDKNKPTIN